MLDKALQELLAPTITALGYELIGVVRLATGGHETLLRVYIDHPNGIGIADCEQVSNQVSGILDLHDPIPGHYTLEVSSPGLDRPLFTLEHFIRFVGHRVKVRLHQPLETRHHFTGLLQQVVDSHLTLLVDGTTYNLAYENIDNAHLVPEL